MEGTQPSAGVILDALSPLPWATPQPSRGLPELERAPGLQTFRGYGLWQEARPRQGPSSVGTGHRQGAGHGRPCSVQALSHTLGNVTNTKETQ